MATTEEKVDKLEIRFSTLEQQVATVASKVDMVIGELQQQREDIRRLQDRQDAIQAKHEAEMKAAQEKQDAKLHEMNQRFYDKVDALSNQIHDTWKQTMIGVGGMIIALGALLITALK